MNSGKLLTIFASVILSFPFGWGLGVLVAYIITGGEIGQLPMITVPFGIIAAIIFSLLPYVASDLKLKILFFGSVALICLSKYVL